MLSLPLSGSLDAENNGISGGWMPACAAGRMDTSPELGISVLSCHRTAMQLVLSRFFTREHILLPGIGNPLQCLNDTLGC